MITIGSMEETTSLDFTKGIPIFGFLGSCFAIANENLEMNKGTKKEIP